MTLKVDLAELVAKRDSLLVHSEKNEELEQINKEITAIESQLKAEYEKLADEFLDASLDCDSFKDCYDIGIPKYKKQYAEIDKKYAKAYRKFKPIAKPEHWIHDSMNKPDKLIASSKPAKESKKGEKAEEAKAGGSAAPTSRLKATGQKGEKPTASDKIIVCAEAAIKWHTPDQIAYIRPNSLYNGTNRAPRREL